MHLVGILFPHINDDARSKSHQTVLYIIRSSLRSIFSEDEYHWIYRKKSTQIFAYAKDVAIVSRNKNALKCSLVNTESEAKKKGGGSSN